MNRAAGFLFTCETILGNVMHLVLSHGEMMEISEVPPALMMRLVDENRLVEYLVSIAHPHCVHAVDKVKTRKKNAYRSTWLKLTTIQRR